MNEALAALAVSWWIVPASVATAVVVAVLVRISPPPVRPVKPATWRVLATAPDPGNAPHLVELLDVPGLPGRWVRAVNGTAPHTVHVLRVDPSATDPIAAVAATYDMTAAQYATCSERS